MQNRSGAMDEELAQVSDIPRNSDNFCLYNTYLMIKLAP